MPKPFAAFALGVALFAAVPAVAQTASVEETAIAAVDACLATQKGMGLSSMLLLSGYKPSARGPSKWSKWVGSQEVMVALDEKTVKDRRIIMCSVAVWGRVPNSSALRTAVETRARREGMPITAPTPRPGGGTDQTMTVERDGRFYGLSVTLNDAADPAKGANYVMVHAWAL